MPQRRRSQCPLPQQRCPLGLVAIAFERAGLGAVRGACVCGTAPSELPAPRFPPRKKPTGKETLSGAPDPAPPAPLSSFFFFFVFVCIFVCFFRLIPLKI